MQLSYAILLGLVAIVAAQTIESEQALLPACSLPCLQNAISAAGCSTTDWNCQCTTKINDITASASPCVLKACSVSEATSVQSITAEICKIALAQSSSSGGSSATSAASSSAESASSSVSSAASSSAAATTSSVSSTTSTAASSVSSTASAAGSTSSSSGGVGQLQVGLGVVGAAVLAALAL